VADGGGGASSSSPPQAASDGEHGSDPTAPGMSGAVATRPRLEVHVALADKSDTSWTLHAVSKRGWTTQVEGDGSASVTLRDVPTGPLWILAVPAPSALVAARRLVEVRSTGAVEATLGLPLGGHLHGRVRTAKAPLPGAWVELAAVHPPARPAWAGELDRVEQASLRAETDAEGRFSLPGVPLATFIAQARHFDHVPKIVRDVVFAESGARKHLEFVLEAGVRLKGVILDREGQPFGGVRVHILRETRPSTFARDSWVATAPDGAFLSPALASAPHYIVKLQTMDRGVVCALEHKLAVAPGVKGVIDVGALSPIGTLTRFRLPADRPQKAYTLVASVIARAAGNTRTMVVANVAFDDEGTVVVAGLPLGKVSWSVLADLRDGRDVSVGSGELTLTRKEQEFALPLDPAVDGSAYHPPPVVNAPRTGPSPLDVLLLRRGAVVYATQAQADGSRVSMPRRLEAGAYELIIRQGGRVGRFPFEMPGAAPIDLHAGHEGRTVPVRLTRGDEPLAGARISILGFDRRGQARGVRALKVTTAADGTVTLIGIPAWSKEITLAVVDPETGKGGVYVVSLQGQDGIHIDPTRRGHEGGCCDAAHPK